MIQYGLNVADEIEKLLSEELTKAIDAEILRSLGIDNSRVGRIKKVLEKIKAKK